MHEFPVDGRSRRESGGRKAVVEHRRVAGRLAQRLQDSAAGGEQADGFDAGAARGRADVRAADDAAERPAEEMHARGVDVDRGRIAVEIEGRRGARERDEVRDRLAHVVARGEQAGEIDEVLAGGIRHAIRARGLRSCCSRSRR